MGRQPERQIAILTDGQTAIQIDSQKDRLPYGQMGRQPERQTVILTDGQTAI